MKKLITLLWFLSVFYLFSMGQSKFSYGKKRVYNIHLLDSAQLYLNSKPKVAFEFTMQVLDESIKAKDENIEARCYKLIGDINYNLEQFDLAIDNYSKALKLYKLNKNKKQEGITSEALAKAYADNKEFDKGEELYMNANSAALRSNNNRKVRDTKRNLADLYSKKGETDKAISELVETKALTREDADTSEIFETNQRLIQQYVNREPSRAIELSNENELIAQQLKDTTALLNTLKSKADAYSNIGDQQQQLNTLYQSLEVRKKQDDISGQSADNLKIGEVLLKQNQIQEAISYLETSISQSAYAGRLETKKVALKTLSGTYDQLGNYNKAYAIYKEYVDVSERSAQDREKKIYENLMLMQSLSKGIQRLNMLENQKLLHEQTIQLLEQEKRIANKSLKQQRVIILTMSIALLILGIAIYLVYKSSKQKRVANQLLALRSLRSQMNPHFIFNALNSVNNFISKSNERAANKFLTDFSKLMRAVMENSEFDFVSLKSEIDIIQLYLKLEHHRFIDKFDYELIVDENIDSDNIQIPPMFIQPYIENAVWHGLRYKEDKGFLKVTIKNGNQLNIIIEDNGIGRRKSQEFKTKNQLSNKATGIKNIDTRLNIINKVHNTNLKVLIEDLDKTNNTGTRVVITLLKKDLII